jgi:hypothetical protein
MPRATDVEVLMNTHTILAAIVLLIVLSVGCWAGDAGDQAETIRIPAPVLRFFNEKNGEFEAFIRLRAAESGGISKQTLKPLFFCKAEDWAVSGKPSWLIAWHSGQVEGSGGFPVLDAVIADNEGRLISRLASAFCDTGFVVDVAPGISAAVLAGGMPRYGGELHMFLLGDQTRKVFSYTSCLESNLDFSCFTSSYSAVYFADIDDDRVREVLVHSTILNFRDKVSKERASVFQMDDKGNYHRAEDVTADMALKLVEAARGSTDVPRVGVWGIGVPDWEAKPWLRNVVLCCERMWPQDNTAESPVFFRRMKTNGSVVLPVPVRDVLGGCLNDARDGKTEVASFSFAPALDKHGRGAWLVRYRFVNSPEKQELATDPKPQLQEED